MYKIKLIRLQIRIKSGELKTAEARLEEKIKSRIKIIERYFFLEKFSLLVLFILLFKYYLYY